MLAQIKDGMIQGIFMDGSEPSSLPEGTSLEERAEDDPAVLAFLNPALSGFDPQRLFACAMTPSPDGCLDLYTALKDSADPAAMKAIALFTGLIGTVWTNPLLTTEQKLGATQDTIIALADGFSALAMWDDETRARIRVALDVSGFWAIAVPD